MTVGMWSWKSKSSKECVTTHRPNGLALKMDGARAEGPYPAVAAMHANPSPVQAATSRRAVAVSTEASDASPGGAAASADLGGSSKYSNENFEGRSGEGFHVNSS